MPDNASSTFLSGCIAQPDCVLLANGNYPTHPFTRHYLNTLPVVCCDGAANAFVAHGGKPIAIVGDTDSLSPTLRQEWAHCLHVVSEQDTNDLTKALHWATANGYRRPLILGATGKREDHTLGNIALLAHYAQQGFDLAGLLTDYGLFLPCIGQRSFDAPIGTRLSIFNFSATSLSSQGLCYPLYPLTALWQGTLNHSITSPFSIAGTGHYLLYFPLSDT